MLAIKFNALTAGTHFDFCYNDYYAVEGRPGFWRKTIPGREISPEFTLVEAECEGQKFIFFRDDQAHEELSEYMKWAHSPIQLEEEKRKKNLESERQKIIEEMKQSIIGISTSAYSPTFDDLI